MMEAAAIIRKLIPGYKSRLKLLQSISFKHVFGTTWPDIKVELSEKEGVVFIGTATDIDKAEKLLAKYLLSLKTSTSNRVWRMDHYKVHLIYTKEAQQFIRDEFVRQDIKCHFVFHETNESVQLFAQSVHDIGKAQSALEKCICVMRVTQNDPFLSSTAQGLSLDYAGKFIEIAEDRDSVFVFTSDIEDAVKKALENVGMNEEETEKVTEFTYSEYKSRVQLLKCLSFTETLGKEKLNVEVVLDSENGVVCKGLMTDIKKAQLVLKRFIEELKTSKPEWRLDSYKCQLLYVKEVQQFLQEEILRQGIKCYFTFQDTDESVKLFACSDADIRKAQSAIEQCVCIMEVQINDQFVLTEATDLSLEFAGKFIQIDEDDKAVFVFTSDIEADVRKARASANSTTDDRETRKLESSEKKSDASGTRTPESSKKKSVAAGTRTPESSEKSSNYSSDDTSRDNDDDDDDEEEEEEEEEEDYGHDKPNQYVYNATSTPAGHAGKERIDPFVDMEDDHGASDIKEESESMAHIISRELYMDVSLAEYLFNVRKADIQQFENKYGLTIGLDCGVVQLLGEGESDQKFDEAIAALEKLASSISMRSMYFNGYSAVDYFTSEKFDSYRERLTGNNRDLVIGPVSMNVGENALATTVVFNDIEVKITDDQMTDLKTVEVMVCPLNSSLVATSSVAEQVLLQGGSILQKRCASAVTKYTSKHDGKPSVGCVFYIDDVGQLSRKLLCAIVVEDWYSNKQALMNELGVSIKQILDHSFKKGFTSIAIPLDIGEKVPALEFGRLCCYAIQSHRMSKNRLQTIHLCVTERRTIHKVHSVVRNTLGLVTEEEVMPVNKAHFQNAADRVRGFKETIPYSKHVMVEVVTESLVEQRVDAIVAVVGESLVLNNGAITRSIVDAGGQEIQDEIKKDHPSGIGPCDVIKSSPGNLPCKLILFGCLPAKHNRYDIEQCLKLFLRNCFELAKNHKIRSLAFPAIGTGNLAYPRDMVAREMFRSVYMYADSCGVRNVKFVLYNKDKVGIQVFKGFKHVYKTELNRMTKDLSKARRKIDVKIGERKGAIEIVNEICESDLSDIIIFHGWPKKAENTDKCLDGRTVRVRQIDTTRFTREILFVQVEANNEEESIVVEAYREALKYAVATRNAQLVTIDMTECQRADIVSTVSEILNILSVVLGQENVVEKVQIVVGAIHMQDLLMNAHKQENKAKKSTGMLSTLTSSISAVTSSISAAVTPKFLVKTPMFWNVVTERGYDNMAGVCVTFIAADDKAIQKAISGFSSEITMSQDGDSSEISEESDSEPDATNNKDDLKQAEIYGKLSLRVSSKVTSCFPKNKLSEITDGINQLDETSATLTDGNINITTEYSKKSVVEQHFINVFEDPTREPDQGPFYIQCVEQRIYNLLELDLKEDDKALDRKIKYNHMSSQLRVNGDRDTYLFISERINTLKAYTSDSIETTNVEQRHKIKKSIDDVKGDFPELIVDVSESEIHIHSPSEVVQKAKHKLKVLLGLVKTTGRARRSIADEAPGAYSSLQPSVSEKYDPGTELRSQYQSMTETRRLHNDDHRKSYRFQKGSTHPVTFSITDNLIVKVYKGSITDLKVDCIVNAANEGLVHAGGVAGVIARAAGKQFEKESEDYVYSYGKVKVTECVATGPGNLRYEYIIHAVGPRWDTYNNKDKCRNDLSQTVLNCLVEADKLRMKSVAIPSISAGIFGMPKEICAEQYGRGVIAFSSTKSHEHLKEIHFVDIQDDVIHVIQSVFSNVFPVISVDDIRSRQVQEECNNDNRASQQETYQHYTDIASGAEKENEPFSTREHQIPNRPYKPGHDNTSVTNQLKRHSSATHERSNSPETEHGLLHKKAVPGHQEIRKPNEDVSPPSNRQAAPPINRQAVPPVPGHQEIRKPNEDVSPPSNRQAAPPSNRLAVPSGNRQTAPQGYRQEPKQTPNRQEPTTVPTTDVSDRSAVSTARASTRTAYAVPVDGTISKLTVHGDRHNPYIFYPLHTEQFSIHVYRHDISMLSVDAVVSIEDEFCRGEGSIAQAINKVCGPAYTVQHKQMKNANLKLTAAHLTTSGEGPTFRYVIHSVAPRWNKYTTIKDLHQYKKLLKTTIGNILQLTRTNKGIGTIGIPVLGVGDETTDVNVCCQVLIDEIMDFCSDRKSFPRNLTQIHLIGHDGGVVFALKELITAALDVKPAFTDQAKWKKITKKRNKNQPKHKNSSQGTPV